MTFRHALSIAQYNWPLYAVASLAVLGGITVACWPIVPLPVRLAAAGGAAIAGWFAGASFLAFHWMFDRSELMRWHWLRRELGLAPSRWVQINAGLEETNAELDEVFPGTEGIVLDIYDPASMTEPAITRARQKKTGIPSVSAPPSNLPVETGWADGVIVVLAAHEIRNRQEREKFFQELARIVSTTGRVAVIEHLRDFAACMAFGPGVFHFYPRREWLSLGKLASLELDHECRITPFIRVFIYRKSIV